MTRWFRSRCDVVRTAGIPAGVHDLILGEFLLSRFPPKWLDIHQLIRSDGELVEMRGRDPRDIIPLRMVI